MKTQYKTAVFMVCTIGFAIFLMSSTPKLTSVAMDDAGYVQPTAYKNLITYQQKDMSVYQTVAASERKAEGFKKSVRNATKSRLSIPTGNKNSLEFQKEDPTAFFEQDLASGKLAFNKGMNDYLKSGGRNLPKQEAANAIAMRFINESGLAPANKEEIKMMHSGGLRLATAGSDKQVDVFRTVSYGRFLDGVPVYGPSSKIIVHVGNNGEIVGANALWKEVSANKGTTVKKEAMKSAKEAELEMNRRLATDFGKGARTKIKEMSLAYYDGGKSYIQPAYYFQIIVSLPKMKDTPATQFEYLGIVPALRKTPEAFEVLQQAPPEAKKVIGKASEKEMKKDPRRDIE
ncbi:hypothetical protein [Ulvibacter litoralis]|uniref:Uncharacterized protein n=1 Tax=Ulvibacter litoralis TaxID=227084 RepID=A0A1G7HHI0_9FLAO|nr:hypothetical protein [Ulvibacter litoralis]GHC57792.1 hypothetical protein GCM10008083_23020 [Ulvibacter litoralis]SDE99801.1 hypothetical protein SAMN05421855_10492 [Ulvibacter litoralis]